MKNHITQIRKKAGLLGVFALFAVFLILLGCEKENTSAPVITRVRYVDPELADEDLTGAGLGSWIVIQGANLASTQEIYFNEYSAYFNPAYVTETDIVIQIPEETPNIGTHPNAPNTIRLVNKHGQTTFSFIIFAPPVQVEYISNEFAADGETIFLLGRYFFLVDSIIFPDEVPAIVFETSADGKSCSVVVPDGTGSGPIRVVSAGGIGGSMYGANMRETKGMICDFDGLNTWEGWGGTVVSTSGHAVLPELTGNAFFAEGTNILTGTYWVQEMAMPITSGVYPNYDTIASAQNVFVKFELFAKGPWNSGEYDVRLVERDEASEWVDYYSFYLKPWLLEDGSIVNYEPDTWITIVIPLSEFTLNSTGESLLSFNEIKDYNFFGCYFQNSGTIPGEQDIPLIQLGVDNIRMVGWKP